MNGFIAPLFQRHLMLLSAVVIVLLGLVASDASAAKGASSGGASFYVPVGRSELISVGADIAEVIVADPEVADVVVHGKRKVSVLGVNVGQTSLRMFDSNHKVIRSLDVTVTYDLPAVRRAIKEFLPGERIGVSMVNTRIALTGEASSAAVAASAMEIAEEFIRERLKGKDAESRKVLANGDTVLSPVINLMKISSGQQVMLRIKIGEVNRSAVRNLGVNLQRLSSDGIFGLGGFIATGTGTAGTLGAISTGGGYKSSNYTYTKASPSTSFGSFGMDKTSDAASLSGQIDALEKDGLLKILAEPTLTALSGEEAQFLAGGELPIPVAQTLGGSSAAVTVEYKPYGVALKFTPFVLSKNRIRINVAPEVSDISTENSITTGGIEIPSFVTRRAATVVELAPGESFMIAGLLRDDMSSTINQLPGASEVPVLGALFRSTAYKRQETELVIAVTPYLVDPIKEGDVKMPTDDFRPPTFFESVFFGAVASNKGASGSSLEGPAGFMTDN